MEQDLRGDYARVNDPAQMESGYPAGIQPPPEALRQYDAIVPGAAERLFRLAEDQAQYRYQLETARIKAEMIRGILAMCFSAAISILLVVGGIVVALSNDNRPESGIPFILFGVILLAGVFIYINASRRPLPETPQVPRQRAARVGRAYDPQGFDL
jgi:uncharacterized membrane protein